MQWSRVRDSVSVLANNTTAAPDHHKPGVIPRASRSDIRTRSGSMSGFRANGAAGTRGSVGSAAHHRASIGGEYRASSGSITSVKRVNRGLSGVSRTSSVLTKSGDNDLREETAAFLDEDMKQRREEDIKKRKQKVIIQMI